MQVILKKSVKGLGTRDQIVKVNDGYARNYLIPNGIAVAMTNSTVATMKKEKKDLENVKLRDKDEAEKLAELLSSKTLIINVDAGEYGRMYGSVTHKDVADKIEETFQVKVDRRKIVLEDEHLKELGEHRAIVKLHPEVKANVMINLLSNEISHTHNDEGGEDHQHHHHKQEN